MQPARPRSAARRHGWVPWFAARWPGFLGLLVTIPLTLIATTGAFEFWPGRTFPGFFLFGNRLVPALGLYSWTGIERDVPFHSRVVAVDGESVPNSAAVYDRVAAAPPGTAFAYRLEKDGTAVDVTVPSMRFEPIDFWLTLGSMLAFGVVSCTLGLGVGFVVPWGRAARAFLVQGVSWGLFAITAISLCQPDLWWLIHPHLVAHAAFPAAWVHLGLVFPVERRIVKRYPAFLALPYAVSFVLWAWTTPTLLADPPRLAGIHILHLYSGLAVLALVALLTISFIEARTPSVRRQLYSVLPGFALGTAVLSYGFVSASQGGGTFPINLAAFTVFFFYFAVGYSIVRHDLFDIGTASKRGLAYGMVTAGIILAYAGAVTAIHVWLPSVGTSTERLGTLVFVVLIAILFEPARRRAQSVVDRIFHRDTIDDRAVLGALSAQLVRLLDVDQIIASVLHTLEVQLGLRSATLLLWHEDARRAVCYKAARRAVQPVSGADFPALERLLARRVVLAAWRPGRDADGDAAARAEAERLGANIVLPLRVGERTLGALTLGRRHSGRVLRGDELQILETLAAHAATALGNALSYHALERANADLERRVAARTAELSASHTELVRAYDELRTTQAQLVQSGKMASLGVLVAGVAHEINNPVTFIMGGLDPLEDAIRELRAEGHGTPAVRHALDRMERAVGAIGRGAERTAGIVRDLRTFSRLNDGPQTIVDLHDDIEVTLRLLHPRWANRITIHRNYGELPAFDAASDKLNQVWMNLLANACDAIAGPGNVWISTTRDADEIRVTICDDGVGIAPEFVPRIFDPFFTTKPTGHGTGLGLAVSHGIVASHGGRIAVESTPGSGTTFTVLLPVRRSTEVRAP